ncbi:MAG TPA: hypothetical protein VF797_19550 [Noviherbaspirillum sp.]
MSNLLSSIKTRFFNTRQASNNFELRNLKSENAAARVLVPGMPRAQHAASHHSPTHSLFSAACQSVNALILSARASALGQAMAKGIATLESTFSPVHAGKNYCVSKKPSSASNTASLSRASAALANVLDAISQNKPNETIKALGEMHVLVGGDEEKLNEVVAARLKSVGKTQVNAFCMVNQLLSNDPWKDEKQLHGNTDDHIRNFYATLCCSFEKNWTAMPR